MSSPRRLIDDTDALPEALLKALRAAPGSPEPAQLQAMAGRLGATLGMTLPAAVGAGASGAVAGKGLSAWVAWVVGGAALGAGLSAIATYSGAILDGPAPGALASSAPAVRARTRAVEATPLPATSIATPTPSSPRRPAAQPPSLRSFAPEQDQSTAADSQPTQSGETELSLLRRAQQALATDPNQALALGSLHAERFPNGLLAQERDVITIDALFRLGRRDEANARARAFLLRYPGSAHAWRVNELLENRATP
jgi:hypothetical protein